jgi:GT2 family glycosyltransferase
VDVSVIICSWNRSRRLALTLAAIAEGQAGSAPEWELVLVNNNCTDDTDAAAEAFRERLPLVYVHEPLQGLSRARMAGLAAAKGELIVFTDDDVNPWPGWLDAYWAAYREQGEGFFFGGPIQCEYESGPPAAALLPVAPPSVAGLTYGDAARPLARWEYFFGPNWACARKPIMLAGGFDLSKGLNPSLGRVCVGEENDLMDRLRGLGMDGWYVPGAGLRHFVPAAKCTLRHIVARAEATGRYRAQSYAPEPGQLLVGGVPLVFFRQALGQLARAAYRWLSNDRAYVAHYVRFRQQVAMIHGLLERRRGRNGPLSGV